MTKELLFSITNKDLNMMEEQNEKFEEEEKHIQMS